MAVPLTFQYVSSRTTPSLVEALNDWTEATPLADNDQRKVGAVVKTALTHRSGEAVTLSFFLPELEKAKTDPRAFVLVGKAISRAYTKHYQGLMSGRSPTGIPGLSFYDSLGNSFPYLDYAVLRVLLGVLDFPWMRAPELFRILSARGSKEHILFVDQVRRFLLVSVDAHGELAGRRARLTESLSIARNQLRKKQNTKSLREEFAEGADRLAELLKRDNYRRRIDQRELLLLEPTLDNFCGFFESSRFRGSAEILVVVATEVEKEAVLSHLGSYSTEFVGPSTYYRGELVGHSAVITRCEAGSVGRDSATLAIDAAIRAVRPRVALMVGIAFGANRKKQHIGDVLVSRSVYSYEPQRIGKDETISRGDEVQSGAVIYNRFRDLHCGWNIDGAKVHLGTILSGEKLVDNPEFLASILKMRPEAIGGEMEGAGLCAAAAKNKVEWILVKAICDWGDGTKNNTDQKMAAEHAISLVEHVLSVKGVLRDLAEEAH